MEHKKNISMKVVKEKTGLTSRQIRYYDEMELIFPARSSGNQRLFSEDDIKRLKKIKQLLDQGYNIEAVREKLKLPASVKKQEKREEIVGKKKRVAGKGLNSLFPVSDRQYLKELLTKHKEEQNDQSN